MTSISPTKATPHLALALGAILLTPDLTLADESSFDDLWKLATLYQNPNNPYLEQFKLRGRYQGQYTHVDSDRGESSDWEDRRSRFGFDALMLERKIELRLDFQSNDGFQDFYDGLVDAYIRYKPNGSTAITLGKTKPLIGQYDWLESTNTQPTFERSQIFNQLNINRATAFTIEGSAQPFTWRSGIYSNSTPATTGGTGSWGDGEFGNLDGGYSYSFGIGYDFKEQLGTEKADARLDWLHSERREGDRVLGRYDDIIASTFWIKQGSVAVVFEDYYATGGNDEDSDVFGFFIQTMYDFVPDKFQLVGRYSFSASRGPNGIRPQGRYESTAEAMRGDTYQSVYLGGQYFIHGDKLKLLIGAEYAALGQNSHSDRYNGFDLLGGLRFSF
ncbi:hypothetical protein JIN85_03615 [Luteolibacter pohnpeiensis]|uniref:Porin n=1 Tax=Luteolibacter pohnpeiensis TaxID=454153 RepID=A0A934S3Z7_9BACT|nr:porin [Luteolibacter pohnpeiensis]MBK1881488.1 hypothetical protein [Luteolibacter pohnpeiensis]